MTHRSNEVRTEDPKMGDSVLVRGRVVSIIPAWHSEEDRDQRVLVEFSSGIANGVVPVGYFRPAHVHREDVPRADKPMHGTQEDWRAIAEALLRAQETGENLAAIRARFGLDDPRAANPTDAVESEIAELKKRISNGRAAHNQECVARDWLAREKTRLESRVQVLEEAIGVSVPTIIRAFRDGLAADARVDREVAEGALMRVEQAMASRGVRTETAREDATLGKIRCVLGLEGTEDDLVEAVRRLRRERQALADISVHAQEYVDGPHNHSIEGLRKALNKFNSLDQRWLTDEKDGAT